MSVYFGNIDEMKTKACDIALIAGENLYLYRTHCDLSLRSVELETGISYSRICSYEKDGIKNFISYITLIEFYRDFCMWKSIGEPEGIRQISSLVEEITSKRPEGLRACRDSPFKVPIPFQAHRPTEKKMSTKEEKEEKKRK